MLMNTRVKGEEQKTLRGFSKEKGEGKRERRKKKRTEKNFVTVNRIILKN